MHDLELTTVLQALKIWHHYIDGGKYEIYMDHKNLKYLFTQKEMNMIQKRWLEWVKDYDYMIHYHLGKTNIVDDALSQKSRDELACLLTNQEKLIKELFSLRIEVVEPPKCTKAILASPVVQLNLKDKF